MKSALFILPAFLSVAAFFPVAAEDVFIPDETYRALSRLTGFDSLFRPTGKRAVAGVMAGMRPEKRCPEGTAERRNEKRLPERPLHVSSRECRPPDERYIAGFGTDVVPAQLPRRMRY